MYACMHVSTGKGYLGLDLDLDLDLVQSSGGYVGLHACDLFVGVHVCM